MSASWVISEFQQKVYAATACIPKGSVTTYQWLAKAIGCASPQAVGQALKRNPFAPQVPCHRVIGHDGRIGGFLGQRHGQQINEKLQRLQEEGVEFHEGRIKEPTRIVTLAGVTHKKIYCHSRAGALVSGEKTK